MDKLSAALDQVSGYRGTYGAISSRLDVTRDQAMDESVNTKAAKSRIEDADYAVETAELARAQVLREATDAMLTQANQFEETVLALLRT